MKINAKLVVCLFGLLLLSGESLAGCRDDPHADDCGLKFLITTEKSVYAPRDSIVFTIELSNHGKQPVYIPASFFDRGVLPCTELPSGKGESYKAIFGAPECDKFPNEGDIVLEVGNSVEFRKFNFAHPELGNQKWSFEGVLYKCPEIPYSIYCEIESNTVELNVSPER